jgi:hypothetical protein
MSDRTFNVDHANSIDSALTAHFGVSPFDGSTSERMNTYDHGVESELNHMTETLKFTGTWEAVHSKRGDRCGYQLYLSTDDLFAIRFFALLGEGYSVSQAASNLHVGRQGSDAGPAKGNHIQHYEDKHVEMTINNTQYNFQQIIEDAGRDREAAEIIGNLELPMDTRSNALAHAAGIAVDVAKTILTEVAVSALKAWLKLPS